MRRTLILLVAVVAVLFVGWPSSDPAGEWGEAAEAYFDELSEAWARSDSYQVVRFYEADVAVGLAQDYRTLSLNAGNQATAVSGDGRAWLVRWIEAQYEPRDRSLGGESAPFSGMESPSGSGSELPDQRVISACGWICGPYQ